jgi:hypothetical protein
MAKDYHTRRVVRIGLGLHYIGFWKHHPARQRRIADSAAKKNIFSGELRKLG